MEHWLAVLHRARISTTPLHLDTWVHLIAKAELNDLYGDIPEGIAHGFYIGITVIKSTYIPSNSGTLFMLSSPFFTAVNKEFNKGRYLGPFTCAELEAVIRPF